jgi:hypothetical protein
MRVTKLLTTALLLSLLYGCIDERGLENCISDVILKVQYTLKGEDQIQKIKNVDLFVFAEDGGYMSDYQLTPDDFAGEGYHMPLEAGKYLVVSWANVSDRSRFSSFVPGVTTIDNCFIETISDITGDPLYYTPYRTNPYFPATRAEDYTIYMLEALPGQSVTKQLEFTRAHRSVNVYVQGLEVIQPGFPSGMVEVTNLWTKYNFLFATQSDRKNFAQQTIAVTTPDGPMQAANFHFAYGEILNDIYITLKGNGGTTITTMNLSQYLLTNPAADRDDIDILISFLGMDLGITITLPGWDATSVTPGID